MKRYLLALFTALIGLVANAANEAYFHVSSRLEAKAGETVELAVAMKNDKPILGYQTWITLPEGIAFNMLLDEDGDQTFDASFTNRKKSVHVLSLLPSAAGGLSMVGYASDGYTPFKGNDGDIFTVRLKIASDAKPGEYKISLSNIAFTPSDMQEIRQADFEVPVIVYEEKTIHVACDETMGTVTGGGVYRGGAEVKLEATPKEGYHFVKWSNGVTDNPYVFTAESDLSLNAEFDANEYQIKYFVDGVEDATKTSSIKYGSPIERAAEPTKTGYTFSGWSDIPATMPAHDVEVNGKFTVNQYTLTFNLYEGAAPVVITQDYDTDVTAPIQLEREGYTFTGWDKDVPAKMPAENGTFTAQWTINSYKLCYKVDGEEYQTLEYNYGSPIERAAEPTKTGYTFSGWSDIPATMPAHDVEVNGKFTVNQYTLTFNLYEGAAPVVITQDYDTDVTAPIQLEREGYTFTGWDKDVPAKMPAENGTFTAQWTINSYKLCYKVDGEEYQTLEYNYGSPIERAAEPTKTGYTFSGWSDIPATMPAHDVEVNGKFTVNQYTLTFNLYEGAVPVVITQDYDTDVTVPTQLEREGYTFTGWDKDVPTKMPAENGTFTAQWTINSYKLTYIIDGEVYKECEVNYGTTITPEEDPMKEGYEFLGWESIPTTMPAHDVVVNGHFNVLTGVSTIHATDKVTVYDLNGYLVVRGVTLSEFRKKYPKGMYIVNGKKIVW